jgi:hypothetical protein
VNGGREGIKALLRRRENKIIGCRKGNRKANEGGNRP